MAARNLMELRQQCYIEIQKIYSNLHEARTGQEDACQEVLEGIRDLSMKILYDQTHDHFMAMASLAALRSKDPHTAIGACIVDTSDRVVGIGYNSMPYVPNSRSREISQIRELMKETIKEMIDESVIKENVTNSGQETAMPSQPPTNAVNENKSFPWNKKPASQSKDDEIEIKKNFVIHAAVNAIINRTIPDLTGCTIYLTQHPDEDCAHLIAQSGIKQVIYWHPFPDRGNRDHEKKAMVILLLAEICVEKYNPKTEVVMLSKQVPVQPQPYDYSGLSLTKRLKASSTVSDESSEVMNEQWVITWDEFFMGLAQLECLYSNEKDSNSSKKVGACIVNDSKQVLAIGGSLGAKKDAEAVKRMEELIPACSTSINTKDFKVEHAEYMAIASYKGTPQSLRDSTLYTTLMPCNVCAKLIVQTGIKEVKYMKVLSDPMGKITKTIFEKCLYTHEQFKKFDEVELQLQQMQSAQNESFQWSNDISIVDIGQLEDVREQNDDGSSTFTVEKLLQQVSQDRKHKKIYLILIEVKVRQLEIQNNDIKINTDTTQNGPTWKCLPKGHGYFRKEYCTSFYDNQKLIYVSKEVKDRLNNNGDNQINIQVTFRLVQNK